MADLYAELGVERSADLSSIRHAYRALARRFHPDVGGDQEAMARLNEAWAVLGDPRERAAYDARLRVLEAAARLRTATRPPTPPGHTVLDFGRYVGWTLANVAAVDDDYLVWLVRTPAGRPMQAEIEELLEWRARAAEALRPVVVARGRRGR